MGNGKPVANHKLRIVKGGDDQPVCAEVGLPAGVPEESKECLGGWGTGLRGFVGSANRFQKRLANRSFRDFALEDTFDDLLRLAGFVFLLGDSSVGGGSVQEGPLFQRLPPVFLRPAAEAVSTGHQETYSSTVFRPSDSMCCNKSRSGSVPGAAWAAGSSGSWSWAIGQGFSPRVRGSHGEVTGCAANRRTCSHGFPPVAGAMVCSPAQDTF